MEHPAWLPPAANPLTPHITVSDAALALDFYERAFGFERGGAPMLNEHNVLVHGELYYFGRSIAIVALEGAFGSDVTPRRMGVRPPISFYVYCPDVDVLAHRAAAAGARVVRVPEDTFWGDRVATIEDPDGYRWTFATHVDG